ncbi:MAG TPA: SH3 domain-containing protein, partial [Candidatus Limnocylindria bacterium]|nr:SH3 domain-containing protein [Candidatus Limnocylindria bacterium]
MGRLTRAAALAGALLIAIAGCTFPPLRTPTPTPLPTLAALETIIPTPSPTASPTPSPTPLPAAPTFAAGEIVATVIDGLRVRQRPSLGSPVVAGLLPLGTELEVAMGPIVVDDNAWYLVRDARAEPAFEEGWIASGFAPEPYLAAAGRTNPASPFVASFAQTGNAQYGPVEITDAEHAIRWIALDPERVRCQLTVLLANPDATPVPVIRATIGNGVDPGILQPGSFAAFGVRGQVFV